MADLLGSSGILPYVFTAVNSCSPMTTRGWLEDTDRPYPGSGNGGKSKKLTSKLWVASLSTRAYRSQPPLALGEGPGLLSGQPGHWERILVRVRCQGYNFG